MGFHGKKKRGKNGKSLGGAAEGFEKSPCKTAKNRFSKSQFKKIKGERRQKDPNDFHELSMGGAARIDDNS